jgi:glutamine synthetase
MADRHVTYKQCLKEIADELGISVTFMAKPFTNVLGSGCHLHLSMTNTTDGTNVFIGDEKITGSDAKCNPLFQHFLAGWMKYTPDMMVFYAPNINSYKRFVNSSCAPTRIAWGYDNRTSSFRVVGQGQSLRIECRIPGADCNIYLAFAAALASGLQGIKDKLPLPPMYVGNTYEAQDLPQIPQTLKEALHTFENSTFARQAFGDDVINHYAAFYRNEQTAYDKSVTDWERCRYFEQI